ncbi:DinB family protein [Ornithinibacillus xuwenensis]|uniref:DinB family protein n=1 Tax=Ornithinibacillus xuwenensis TaxID=3144668 RepID=A0ABU9XGP7_9BACI
MNSEKKSILEHYQKSIEWVNNLSNLSEKQWRMPIATNKWTVAEVIGHLIPWDEFILMNRIPYFFEATNLPKSPEVEAINQKASVDSKEREKEETITIFTHFRREIISALEKFEDAKWTKEIVMNQSTFSLYHYFSGLVEHDIHHFQQIHHAIGVSFN